MTVTLSKRAEEIVSAQLDAGLYATPDEAINGLIEGRISPGVALFSQPGTDAAELKMSLLAAVGNPTFAHEKGDLVRLAKRGIDEDRGA